MRDRRLALQNTPADLFDAYATTLKRINQQPEVTARQALDVIWLVPIELADAPNPSLTTFDDLYHYSLAFCQNNYTVINLICGASYWHIYCVNNMKKVLLVLRNMRNNCRSSR
jgi:hypothetical protein